LIFISKDFRAAFEIPAGLVFQQEIRQGCFKNRGLILVEAISGFQRPRLIFNSSRGFLIKGGEKLKNSFRFV